MGVLPYGVWGPRELKASLRVRGLFGGLQSLVLLGCVRQQRDRPGALERHGQGTLVPRTGPGDAPRQDLAAIADKPAQPRNLLVIDVVDLLRAKRADLAMLPLRSPRTACGLFSYGWTADCHEDLLKRDFVRVDVARGIVRSWNVVGSRGTTRRGSVGRACAAAAVEELDVVGDDLRGAPLLPVLAFPGTGLDASLHEDQGALACVLG